MNHVKMSLFYESHKVHSYLGTGAAAGAGTRFCTASGAVRTRPGGRARGLGLVAIFFSCNPNRLQGTG